MSDAINLKLTPGLMARLSLLSMEYAGDDVADVATASANEIGRLNGTLAWIADQLDEPRSNDEIMATLRKALGREVRYDKETVR